jgi:hypothetical protein
MLPASSYLFAVMHAGCTYDFPFIQARHVNFIPKRRQGSLLKPSCDNMKWKVGMSAGGWLAGWA